jgi:Fe-S cluster biogenesis protein NfuA
MRKIRKQRSKARRLGCLTEALENRLFLDGTVAITTAAGVVTVLGDAKDNAISISMSGGNYVITGVDTTDGPTLVKLNGGVAGASQSFLTTTANGDWTIDMSTGGNDSVPSTTGVRKMRCRIRTIPRIKSSA